MTVTNNGTAEAYPIVVFTCTGSDGVLYHLKNTSTDDEIYFNYTMQNGETATLDLRRGKKTFTSTFLGNLLSQGAIIEGSDVTTLRLLSGSLNNISIFTGADVSASLKWDTTYLSFDG